jgi:hypothetical protein
VISSEIHAVGRDALRDPPPIFQHNITHIGQYSAMFEIAA